jgi:hypothetical protein
MINIKEFKNKNSIKIENKEVKSSNGVDKFIEKIFEARQVAHNHHLKTRSYSEHKALDSFYNGLLDFVDDFTETYQGQYGLIESPKVNVPNVENIVNYLEDFCKTSTSARAELKDGHLQNIIDEILSLTYKTIYKLKYLK